MQSKTNLFQLMPVMSEILFGKNPSQSVSQTNLPLYTPSAVSCLVCHFFLAKKKKDQVRKESTSVFELYTQTLIGLVSFCTV